jgi:(4-(4-[2-(gamma-L-glutamylamino)ethyl]phenoxymethyl)furan-2-yl)methanamine synthase
MKWLAIDIGGANLKLADGQGYAASYTFSMWKDSRQLAQELRTLIAEAPESDHLAITMTGELADCFETRTDGVKFILQAVKDAADARHTRVYLTNGTLVTPQVAITKPLLVAAANWHALARFSGRFAKRGAALLIDIGSTTCDTIPLVDGQPQAAGTTDLDRLLSGELVYTGVERSPVCAIVQSVPYHGRQCPVAQELFATSRDVYLLLGDLREDPTNLHTADNRPATKAAARVRLGRMIGADGEQFQQRDALEISQFVAAAQVELIASGLRQVLARLPQPPTTAILSGQGEFLAKRVFDHLKIAPAIVSLSDQLGLTASRCGPAHALAVLAREAAGL